MELLYFDHDHGVERLLFVRLDEASRSVHFRLVRGPDPTHDEDGGEDDTDLPAETLSASTVCSSIDQFFGFCRALVAAMRETPFSLQDPHKKPFAVLPHERLVLDGVGEGVPPAELSCRIPREIASELVGPDRTPQSFTHLLD